MSGRTGWAYRDANGRPLIGPCADLGCTYRSLPGGGDHTGKHSRQDGTTGWPHDYGVYCECPTCASERSWTSERMAGYLPDPMEERNARD